MDETVTIPRAEYERRLGAAEDLADVVAYDKAIAAIGAGEDELIPAEYLDRILKGESPVRVWRGFRYRASRRVGEGPGSRPGHHHRRPDTNGPSD